MKLAPSYENTYIEAYDANNAENTLAGKFLQKSHALLESGIPTKKDYPKIIEVGSGTGNHLPFVRHGYDSYLITDANQMMLDRARQKYAQYPHKEKLIFEIQDANNLKYADNSFNRLIATHVLEHIPDPVSALKEWNRVVEPGGLISIVLPCDPGLLWRLGRNFGPRRNAKKAGIEYDYLQAAEHVNSIYNLKVFIEYHFEVVYKAWYPLNIPLPDINLFYICHLKSA